LSTTVLQGSVATWVNDGWIFSNFFIANLLLSVMVEEFWRSVRIWQNYGKNTVAPFSGHGVYGLECCQLNKADLQSLDFSSNRLFMKLFRTASVYVVQECRSYFGIELLFN